MPKLAKRVDIYKDGFVVDGVEFPYHVKDVITTGYQGSHHIIEMEFVLYVDEELYYHDDYIPEKYKRKTGRRCRVWG